MKKIVLGLVIMIFMITACAPTMDEPVNSDEPSSPQTGDYIPDPADSNLTRDAIYLETVDLLTMESFPLQFTIVLKGNLPTPCHELRVAVSPPDPQNNITVDVYSVVDPLTICVQVLESFEENIPLGSFPTRHYTLWVNGEQITEFDS